MAVYSKQILSGSTNGMPIPVTGVLPSTGNTVHTALADNTAGIVDEVWLWAYVRATVTADRKLRLVIGQPSTVPKSRMEVLIPGGGGMVNVIPGLPFNNAKVIKAYVTLADEVNVIGYVNRVT